MSHATHIFSIDVSSQRLVTVDSSNGNVTPIGTGLGASGTVLDADLTYHAGFVYAAVVMTSYQNRFLEIDPFSGSVVRDLAFNRPGNYFDYVEGLAVAQGRLWMSSVLQPGSMSYASDGIFELDFNANVLSEFSYRPWDPLADFDSLEGLPDGTLLTLDNEPGNYKRYITAGSGPHSYALVNTSFDVRYSVNDWAADGTHLVGVNDYTATVATFDLATGGLLYDHALSGSYDLRGAALNPVPEPTTMAVLAAGALGLASRRRRQAR